MCEFSPPFETFDRPIRLQRDVDGNCNRREGKRRRVDGKFLLRPKKLIGDVAICQIFGGKPATQAGFAEDFVVVGDGDDGATCRRINGTPRRR